MASLALLLLLLSHAPCSADDSAVRRQYESLPYPAIRLSDDGQTNVAAFLAKHATEASRLKLLDHYVYRNRMLSERGPSAARPLRILNAGGGTGLETALLAHDLSVLGLHGEIVHVDLSSAALGVTRRLLESLGLERYVTLTRSPIEAFVEGAFGWDAVAAGRNRPKFDLIVCTGVLHHLESPTAALGLLRDALAPGGGILLSVYGRHGRHGVYEMQEALRTALPGGGSGGGDDDDGARLGELRRLFFGDAERGEAPWIPPTAAILSNAELSPASVGPSIADEELFDRLLHSRDVAYTVPELYALVASVPGGLRAVALFPEATYDPDCAVFRTAAARNSSMARRVRSRPLRERQAFAELMTSRPAFDRVQHETLGNHMFPKLSDPRQLLPMMDARAQWAQDKFLQVAGIARSLLEQVCQTRLEVRAVLPDLDELAGRERIVRAARGEEYDPMTGELVKIKSKKKKKKK